MQQINYSDFAISRKFGNFATPKKLNRSTAIVPADIISKAESENVTTEDLQRLKLPTYVYQTCVTIHGEWSKTGDARYIHVNANGSIELAWLCIDREKVRRVHETLSLSGMGYKLEEKRTGRYFTRSVIHENIDSLRDAMIKAKEIENRLTTVKGFWGSVSFAAYKTFLGITSETIIYVYGVLETSVTALIEAITGKSMAELKPLIEQGTKERDERNRKIEQDHEEWKKRHDARIQEMIQDDKRLSAAIAHLPITAGIMSGVTVTIALAKLPTDGWREDSKYRYVFYKFVKNGSFGRVVYAKAVSDHLSLDSLQWVEEKQTKVEDINRLIRKGRQFTS